MSTQPFKEDGEAWILFKHCAKMILRNWDALRRAVDERWAGDATMDKYEKILCDLYFNCRERWEEDNTVHVEDLEDFLYHAMLTDFHCELQDDSSMQVAKALHRLYYDCREGRLGPVKSFAEGKVPGRVAPPQAEAKEAEEEEEASADGWTTVKKKGKKKAPQPAVPPSGANVVVVEGREEAKEGGEEGGGDNTSGGGGSGAAAAADDSGWTTVASKKKGGKR